jgi:Mg/Co/Ni transporter MgtE
MASNNHAAAANEAGDLAAHESTYAAFVALTEIIVGLLICIVLCLVLWGLEGHGFVALVGMVVACVAAAVGSVAGYGWRALTPIIFLLGLASIVLK